MPAAFLRPRFRSAVAGLLLTLALAGVVQASAIARVNNQHAQQAQAKKKLAAIKDRIQRLTRELQKTANHRNQINATLSAQATRLDDAARAVRQSETAIAEKNKQIKALEARRALLDNHLKSQRAALAELLRAAYALGRGSDRRLLLGNDDIARIDRALVYSRYFQHDRMARIQSLLGDLNQLHVLETSIHLQQQALKIERDQRKSRMQALASERDKQRALLAQTQTRLKQQGHQLKQLQRNQRALNALINRLGDVFADIPRTLSDEKPFAERRGKLSWPVHGKLASSGDGVSIDAPRGTVVRAVAHGRVAFANFLRGYGMLIIVDHGNGWMSLYGDNESLLHDVGDWVNAGEAIGTSGIEAGGHEGVYFGLRHGGRPVDPRPWLKRHP
jgi:septal ring factor EnvC (AmiA/AmiB activator)